jgi:ergothioneine biosynthesis protein EgtB
VKSQLDREALIARFHSVRGATEALAEPLSPEDQLLQSMPSASPTKWHRAHTTWFFEEFFLAPRGVPAFDPSYRFLFNSYYEAVGPRHPRPARGMLSRPSCDEVAAYRRAIDGRMHELLGSLSPPELEALAPLVELGLAHEEQHQELLLTDIQHALYQNPTRPAYRRAVTDPPGPASTSALAFEAFEGGLGWLGSDGADGFVFDNEGPRHQVFLEPFELARRPISFGEVLAFIEAGGYREPSLWLAEGFDLVRASGHSAPLYLEVDAGAARVFTLNGLVDVDRNAPASCLSYYESDAVARFLGGRLPTEAEWERCAMGSPATEGNFRESGHLRTKPSSAPDVRIVQLYGDVWEWTCSAYSAYPSFRAASGALGEYNGKFMVNQLVLRGGSCFTPRGHVRPTYRNFWHPDTRFQMAGARVARSLGRADQEGRPTR